ncbi:MAG: serine protease Do [Planctomycetota bacterium]|jgi:serine protease Do
MNNRYTPTSLSLAVLAAIVASPLSGELTAQNTRTQSIRTLSQGDAVRQIYAPIIKAANRSVVEIIVDGEARVLGTVVGKNLVVTKYSELTRKAKQLDNPAKLQCRKGKDTWSATQIGFDRPADLALLRVAKAKLTPVQWQTKVPDTGAFTASPDGTSTPLGVGILASAPYQHSIKRAFLGIRFKNADNKPAELGEVVANGAARAAGLLANDVVVQFHGQRITETQQLREAIHSCKPGDTVSVTVQRGEEQKTFELKLGTNNNAVESGQEDVWGDLSDVRSGFQQVLQHDTVLTPADCGGPVVDLNGKVLGVNIARAGRVETLALPATQVQRLVEALLKKTEPAATTTKRHK